MADPTVDNATIVVSINLENLAVINHQAINSVIINGLVAHGNVRVTQVYQITVNNAAVAITVSAIDPTIIYLAKPQNANIGITASKVYTTKSQGSHLFVTVIDGVNTSRFSFGGIKA